MYKHLKGVTLLSILLQTHLDGDNAAFRVSKLVFYTQLFGKEKQTKISKQTNKQTNKQKQQQQQQKTNKQKQAEEGGRHEVYCL